MISTVLDDRIKSTISTHVAKQKKISSQVWEACARAHRNTKNHANPYFNSRGEKVYPEKVNVAIVTADIVLMYFHQRGKCHYTKLPFDVHETINGAYHPHGISPNRRLNGLSNHFTTSNTVLVTQAVFRDKGQHTEDEYRLRMNLNEHNFEYDAIKFKNYFNSELNRFIMILNDLDHLGQVNKLITELKTFKLL